MPPPLARARFHLPSWCAAWLGQFRGRWARREIVLLCLCPVLLVATALTSERVRMRGHVLPGVVLQGEVVAGYSERALLQHLEQRERELHERVFRIRVDDAVFRVSGAEIGASLRPRELTQRVLAEGRSGSLLTQLVWRLARWSSDRALSIEPTLDERLWHEQLAAYERAVLDLPREGNLAFAGARVRRVEPQAGREIDRAATTALLRGVLLSAEPLPVIAPLSERAPASTSASLDAVERQAVQLLSGPLVFTIQLDADGGAEQASSGPELHEVLLPKHLGSALRVVPYPTEPTRLRLELDPEGVRTLLSAIAQRWERPARDARFIVDHKNQLAIEPSAVQIRLDLEHAARAILEAGRTGERRGRLRLVAGDSPRISTELAHSLGIRGLVAQFTTQHPCCQARVQNIHRIADLVNGAVVLPGEVFSLNGLVGPRSRAKGFEPAPTIVHGKIEDTFGGGISQFTTTLFNAVLNGGYEIIERQPHSFYFPRYPLGHEATLSYPKPDFIFENDTRAGVLITTEYGSTFIRVKIFGDNEGRRVEREVSPRVDWKEPPVEYVADDGVLPGEEEVRERGSKGFSVRVTRRVHFPDGRSDQQSRKVTYEPRPRVLAVHSCQLPQGHEQYTGLECPEPEEVDTDIDAGVPDPIVP